MSFNIVSLDSNEMEVNISGIDAPLANALRRVMIADIPTMAYDKVVLYQNTSIIHDEVLAHRLGLIPVMADPEEFIAKGPNDDFNEHNSVKFNLNVKCTRKPEFKDHKMADLLNLDPEEYLDNCTINTSSLVWEPLGNQEKELKTTPKVLHDKILLLKLRENQEVEFEVYCSKNIGRVHAKWSPVATAYYRLKPLLELKEEITGADVRIKSPPERTLTPIG
jgi:DNA-directed RNA polymerase I and III subunit RPAC1